jgi:F0F1-type ATP synthase assembly protein I
MNDLLAASGTADSAIGDALRSVALFVPKFVVFLIILVIGWLVARVLLKAVDKILERVGFDRLVERGGIRSALSRSRYDASDIVARVVYYAVLLFTLQLAFGVWGPNPVSNLIGGIVAWLPKAIVAIIIVVVAAAIANAVRDLVTGALGGLSYGRLIANILAWFIIGIGVIAALNQIGVATTVTTPILVAVLATIAGILIVGVGGGLVRPMQRRWENWLDRAEAESGTIAEHARAYSAGRRDTADRLATEQAGTVGAPAQETREFPKQQPPDAETTTFLPPRPGDDAR